MQEKGCVKCGNKEADTKEISTTGSGLSKMFDVQHNRFTVVSCKNCGYSELYSKDADSTSNVLDFFFGG
ncbi:zinc ribbon domain-containing protein [Alkalicoccus urumqiensis]|uniref:Nucleic acid-binding protein n=1 Tax=Alkalicoccus urumqiensis TaxID=1548213 RepID=A0A2P6MLG0_ALKUR|nr:zinc ribbon domain-containing protein [Alkalicoccus urumqiensis]PRO67114.1 hypothetical protein C6I21_00670 [Alkalicoccus urumqiensis]